MEIVHELSRYNLDIYFKTSHNGCAPKKRGVEDTMRTKKSGTKKSGMNFVVLTFFVATLGMFGACAGSNVERVDDEPKPYKPSPEEICAQKLEKSGQKCRESSCESADGFACIEEPKECRYRCSYAAYTVGQPLPPEDPPHPNPPKLEDLPVSPPENQQNQCR